MILGSWNIVYFDHVIDCINCANKNNWMTQTANSPRGMWVNSIIYILMHGFSFYLKYILGVSGVNEIDFRLDVTGTSIPKTFIMNIYYESMQIVWINTRQTLPTLNSHFLAVFGLNAHKHINIHQNRSQSFTVKSGQINSYSIWCQGHLNALLQKKTYQY